MIKKLSKINSILIGLIVLFIVCVGCSTTKSISIKNVSANSEPVYTYEQGSSATLVRTIGVDNGDLSFEEDIFCDELIFTNDDSKIPSEPIATRDVSDDNLGTIKGYLYQDSENNYKYLVHGAVETIYAPANCKGFFNPTQGTSGYDVLNKLKKITFECFDTSNVTNMSRMFAVQTQLLELDLSCFNTEKVTDMSQMFYQCKSLRSINLSSFDTGEVTNMSQMFLSCQNLENINLSNFNTEKVTNFSCMFIPVTDEYGNYSKEGFLNLQLANGQASDISPDDEYFFSKMNDITDPTPETEQESKQLMETYFGPINETWCMPYKFDTLDLSNFVISEGANVTNMISTLKNLKQIKAPKICAVEIELPQTMVEQNTTDEYTKLSNASNNKILVLASSGDTPSTGFVDEQLLPAITISLVSVLAVVYVTFANKKKFNKN